MSGKRRHAERQEQLKRRRQRDAEEASATRPPVDLGALALENAYVLPEFVTRGYYLDRAFVCRACGVPQTWSAERQKWWYEVAKGSVYSIAKLCRQCRKGEPGARERVRQQGGDPNPYKTPGHLLAAIRSRLEPDLMRAGFSLIGRSRRLSRRSFFLDFSRSDDLLTISWERSFGRFTAERLSGGGDDFRVVATANIVAPRSTTDIEDCLEPFLAAVRKDLNSEPPRVILE